MWEALVYYIHPLLHISLFLNHIQLNECKLAIELNRAWKMEQTEQKQNRCIVFSQSKQLVFHALIQKPLNRMLLTDTLWVYVFETNWRDFQEIIFYSLKMIITAKLLMNIYRWFMRSMLLYNTLKGKKHWNLLTKIVFNLKIILSQKNFFDRSHFSGLWIIFQN